MAYQKSRKLVKVDVLKQTYTVEKGARVPSTEKAGSIWLEILRITSNETSALDIQSIFTTIKVQTYAYGFITNDSVIQFEDGRKFYVITDIMPADNGKIQFSISSKNAK